MTVTRVRRWPAECGGETLTKILCYTPATNHHSADNNSISWSSVAFHGKLKIQAILGFLLNTDAGFLLGFIALNHLIKQ